MVGMMLNALPFHKCGIHIHRFIVAASGPPSPLVRELWLKFMGALRVMFHKNTTEKLRNARMFLHTPIGNLEINRFPNQKIYFDVIRDSSDRLWIWNGSWVATWYPRKRR